jgi:putative salt-induced outer membrane protein
MNRSLYAFLLFCLISLSLSAENNKNKWNIHAELSYVKTSGNSETETFATKIEGIRDFNATRLKLKGDFLYGKAEKRENTNKLTIDGRIERVVFEKFFGFAEDSYYRDKFSGYDYRNVLSAGIGYDILKTEKHKLKGMASLGYAVEKYRTGGSEEYPTGGLNLEYAWNIQENLKFKQELKYETDLNKTKIYFLNSNTALEVKINEYLSLGVGLKIAYQNKPPSESIKKTDKTFLTSLIYDF